MIVRPLTSVEVKSAKAQGKDFSLHDGFGLLLYITSRGGKSWRFRYVHPVTKKRQTYTIGRYPEFTLSEAREERSKLRRMVARGIDPNEVKKDARNEQRKMYAQSFQAVADEWLKIKIKEGARSNTLESHNVTLKHLSTIFKHTTVHKINAADTIQAFKPFRERPSTLTKMVITINAIMDYAVNIGVIEHNPLSKIGKAFPAEKNEPRATLQKERLPEFLSAWNELSLWEPSKLALLFQIITMVRPSEAGGALWNEIDFDNSIWQIPANRMKGKRPHVVPLSSQAINVLKEAEKWKRCDYVFPSWRKENKPISRCATQAGIHKTSFKGLIVPHGFRALASTVLNDEGFNPDVIEAALAHKSADAIRNVYNRSDYLEKRRVLMQWWGDFIEAAERGEILETSGDKGLRLVV
ncbi:TPA: tyrosine-type recombinase/integrase [Escherichia coli]|uniref:integrase arm-type DNA-binding domain-containing protein n=1 Tax=Enterobacterales TaxID=91347 RepID=UPI000B9758C9|nr:integrase arm-type DNA-binding domain-containing protein [Serratia marcescens]EFN4711690.1 tyrosine-type recombinase/integrase [Escherichia coli]EFN5562466.1 tyrosine-type recombinase/integrase [Escherichia coli]OYO93176.1 hypothetical protein CHR63_23325 [Serratia marcescens]HAY4755334.1 tyrosine-type recombinase/integrase [Escherichia coli]HAY5064672.1 tyrosine-type recombinase/integrase [Escherichia coli]